MEILEQLALLSGKLFWQVINLTITGSIAILAILILRLPLQRAPKRFSYTLWSVAAFRLLCPVSFSSAISLFGLDVFKQASILGSRQDSLDYLSVDTALLPVRQAVKAITEARPINNGLLSPLLSSSLSASQPVANAGVQWSTFQILSAVAAALWLVGILAMLLYSFLSYTKVRRHITSSVRLTGNIHETDRILTPFILGFFRPRIYLPFRLSEHERPYIVQHEQFHIRRGDHLVKPLAFTVLALHWFNPLVWLAFSSMLRDMEMRCDEAVLNKGGHAIKREYSESLLTLATHSRLPVTSPLAFGESNVKARIKNVLNFRKPKAWILLATLLLCIVVVFMIAANPTDKQSELVSNDDSTLNEAIHQAVLLEIEKIHNDPKNEFVAEAHTILKAIASGNQVTAYTVVLEQRYTFNDQGVEHFSGSHMPVVLTFQKTDDQNYQLLEYWMPEEGTNYGKSINRKFPEEIVDKAFNLQLYLDDHENACTAQVLDYYEATYKPLHVLTGSQDHVVEFLQLASDTGFDKLPRMYPDDTCYNVTPDYIYVQTGCRIFKYSESCESFLLADGKIYSIGIGFGGLGLTDIQLCDFDRNGQADLLYTFSAGSGMHISRINHFNLTTKEETRPVYLPAGEKKVDIYFNMMNELYLVKLADDHFVVYTAERVANSAFENQNFAHISLVRKDRQAEITVDNGEINIMALD